MLDSAVPLSHTPTLCLLIFKAFQVTSGWDSLIYKFIIYNMRKTKAKEVLFIREYSCEPQL
jgi:hypothetical protein